jgi:hypothetical protein
MEVILTGIVNIETVQVQALAIPSEKPSKDSILLAIRRKPGVELTQGIRVCGG